MESSLPVLLVAEGETSIVGCLLPTPGGGPYLLVLILIFSHLVSHSGVCPIADGALLIAPISVDGAYGLDLEDFVFLGGATEQVEVVEQPPHYLIRPSSSGSCEASGILALSNATSFEMSLLISASLDCGCCKPLNSGDSVIVSG